MSAQNALILTVGLPRSGKTTWALERWHGTGTPIVSPDAIRLALHGQRFQALAEPFVWAIAKVMVRALFMAGHPTVIVDATNTTRKRRDEWHDGAWEVSFHEFATPADECIRRARAMGDEEIVPIIERMAEEREPVAEDELRAVAAWAGDPQVHSADCNVTMGRRSADHRIHCDCTVAAGDRPPAPSDVLLAALEAHRRYHRTLCGGDDDCYVCQAEDTLRAVRPPPRAPSDEVWLWCDNVGRRLTVERLAELLKEMGETVLPDDYSMRDEWDKLAAWLLPRLAAPTPRAAALETLLAWVQSELHREPDDESFRSPVWYCGYCDTSGPARETIAHVASCPVAAALAVLTMAGAASPAAAPQP